MNTQVSIITYLLIVLSLLSIDLHGQSLTGGIAGKVVDKNGTALDSASLIIVQNGHVKGGSYSDANGYYSIKPITEGAYNLIIEFKNFKKTITNTIIKASKTGSRDNCGE